MRRRMQPRHGASAPSTATVSIAPPHPKDLRITYAPSTDGDPDAGEIVWTWVPYAENDGRGKDRPVLVIGRSRRLRVYAVRLTSRSHDGDRDFLAIGAGPWDVQRRPSWIDIEQLYSVHARACGERHAHSTRAIRARRRRAAPTLRLGRGGVTGGVPIAEIPT